jgi:hypothetical protein
VDSLQVAAHSDRTKRGRRPFPLLPLDRVAELEEDMAATIQAGLPMLVLVGAEHLEWPVSFVCNHERPQAMGQAAVAAVPPQPRSTGRVVREPGGRLALRPAPVRY